jgi:hypothetical protein
MKYTIEKTLSVEIIVGTDDEGNEIRIPKDLANFDYQTYLKSINN